jgi:hypothetical protein
MIDTFLFILRVHIETKTSHIWRYFGMRIFLLYAALLGIA